MEPDTFKKQLSGESVPELIEDLGVIAAELDERALPRCANYIDLAAMTLRRLFYGVTEEGHE